MNVTANGIGPRPPLIDDRRGEVMVEPDEVSAMLRLKHLGWGTRRIAAALGVSRTTVKDWLGAGGWRPYRQPVRWKALDGRETWLRERFLQHRGNADVLRQELAAEKNLHVSLRTVERAVAAYRQELEAEARATVRFETPPGKQMQIDFGERLVEIAGPRSRSICSWRRWAIRGGSMSAPSATSGRRAGSRVWRALSALSAA